MSSKTKEELKSDFRKILPLFHSDELKRMYQDLFDEYIRCYSHLYLREIIKNKLFQSKEYEEIQEIKLEVMDEIVSYVDQLLKALQKKETFHHFIFMSLLNEKGAIPFDVNQIGECLKKIKKNVPMEASRLVDTIIDSVVKNYKTQKKSSVVNEGESPIVELKRLAEKQKRTIDVLKFDYENLKARTKKREGEMKSKLTGEILEKMIPFIDHFDLAMNRCADEERGEFYQGVKLIFRQMTELLKKEYGFSRMDVLEKKFDHDRHEAVAYEEHNGVKDEIVLEEIAAGYELNGKVLKYPKVKVGKSCKIKKIKNTKKTKNSRNRKKKN